VRVGGAVLLLCGCLLGPPAGRLSADPRQDPASGLDWAPAAVSAREQARVTAYWTDRRVRQAVRPDTAPAAGADSGPTGGSGTSGGASGGAGRRGGRATAQRGERPAVRPAPVRRAAEWRAGGPASRAIGRVFFTLDRLDYSCSGTALRSGNGDTVLTAAHCLNAGPGAYARNWVFIPAYRDGRRPYGTWTARRLAAPTGWVRAGRAPDDVGFAVLNRLGGRHLTGVVGGLRIGFGAGPGRYAWAFGYPGGPPYLGRRVTYCRGTGRRDPYGTTALGLDCTMGAGSSGGPWVAGNHAGDPAGGTVYSVTSFAYHGVAGVIWGPRLGATAAALFAAAQRW
jgi:V8-like Glu-specific endopeptidase